MEKHEAILAGVQRSDHWRGTRGSTSAATNDSARRQDGATCPRWLALSSLSARVT